MSDPVTNVEIEDILSSIRRLVSEDGGPRHPLPREAKRVERLVLTPALRVQDAPPPRPQPAPEPMLLTNPSETPEPAQPSRLARLVEREVARVFGSGDDRAGRAGKDESVAAEDSEDIGDTAAEAEDDPVAEIADWTRVRLSEPMSRYDHDAVGLDTPEDEEEPSDAPDEAELDAVLDALASVDEPAADDDEALSLEALQDVQDTPEDDTLDLSAVLAEAEAVTDFGPMDRGLEAKIAALEALINSREDSATPVATDAQQAAPDHADEGESDADTALAEPDSDATSYDRTEEEDPADDLSDHVDEAEALVHMMSQEADSWDADAARDAHQDAARAESHADVTAALRPTLSVVPDDEVDVWDDLADETPEPEKQQADDPEESSARAATGPAFRHRPPEPMLDWEDHAPRRDSARQAVAPRADADREEETSQPVAQASDDVPYLDEAMLRDMVSEIVRQELQGVLGERITRNVRKLVRREIHRVMMTQDFD